MGREGVEPSSALADDILSVECIPFHHRPTREKGSKEKTLRQGLGGEIDFISVLGGFTFFHRSHDEIADCHHDG